MKKRMPFPYWLAILAGFVLAGLFILKGFLYYAYWGEYNPERIRHMVAVHLANNVLWGVLTPIVYYFVSQYRVYPPAKWSERSKAIAASIFMAFFHETLSNIIIVIPFHLLGIEKISWENTKVILGLYPSAIIARLIEYWIIYAVFTAIDYQRKFRTKELELAQLENQLSVAQLNALRLQLQPHFLFNTLNTISSLMEFNVKGAQKIVSKLGGLLRKVLDGDNENLVELRDEIEFVRSYLDIEQVRFNDRLRVEYHIDERTLNALVPNLILQPLMENAIKHGFAQKTGDGLIEVFTTLKDDQLCLKIADDGHGSGEDQKTLLANGIGLKNVVDRLELLYPGRFNFRIESNENQGFAVILEMPFQTKKG